MRAAAAVPAALSEHFDHFMDPHDAVRLALPRHVHRDTEILHVGCGSSLVGPTLYNMGFRFVTNIDVDPTVVAAMSARFAAQSDMQFVVMDASDTRVPAHSFGMVLDKALLDTMLADQPFLAEKYLKEMQRLLVPGGSLVIISHGVPDKRLPLLAQALRVNPSVSIKVSTFPKPMVRGFDDFGASADYFCYQVTV